MESSGTLHRRMAFLFLIAVGLIAWQAPRTKPAEIPPIVVATREGEQLFPIAVPEGAPAHLPTGFAERRALLDGHSVAWAGSAGSPTAGRCALYLRISAQHWARRSLAPGELARLAPNFDPFRPGSAPPALRLAASDFADDDDGDGDALDPGELHPAPAANGAEVEVDCRP